MTRLIPLLTAFFIALLMAAAAVAQQTPRVGYVFPAGGQQGSTFEVRVGGQFLDGVSAAHLSGSGVSVKVVQLIKPMTPQQANQLREKLQALVQKKNPAAAAAAKPGNKPTVKPGEKPVPKPDEKPAVKPGEKSAPQTVEIVVAKPGAKPAAKPANPPAAGPARPIMLSPEEEQMIVDLRKKLAKFAARMVNPAIADTAVLQITVDAGAPPGARELRLETPAGLTNPLVFEIGRLNEVVNKRGDDDDAPPRILPRQLVPQSPASPGTQATVDIQLPSVVNGQILAGQVDRYRFVAKKGQQLVIAVDAQKLVPYIADAVPGWFQAAITLRDEGGAELASAGSFLFHPDPVLHYQVPRDGKYVVEISDSIFRGREDFVYRMAIGELPYVTSVFPLGGKLGEVTRAAVQGWNLTTADLAIDGKYRPTDVDQAGHRLRKVADNVSFALDSLPQCNEQEPNDSPEQAQKVTLPIIVNGRVDRPGDRDVFRFEGKQGQQVVAEVYARRLGSPLDSVLKLTDATGRQLAFNDDYEDKSCGLLTHQADSWLTAKLPANGTYYIHLYDVQNQGGPDYGYRLRIGPPQPDFDLRIVPSSVNMRWGAATAITVYALRREGFNGPIELELKNPPAGYYLSGATILAGQEKVRCTLSAPAGGGQSPVALQMEGRATIQGREVRRAAVPADDMMQAFFYHHLVPAQQWLATLVERGRGVPLVLRNQQPLKLPSGGTAVLHFNGPHGPVIQTVQFALSEPPAGLAIQKTAFTNSGMDVTLRADAAKLKAGWKGNVIIEASVVRQPDPKPGQPNPPKRRVSLGVLPAAPLEVVAK